MPSLSNLHRHEASQSRALGAEDQSRSKATKFHVLLTCWGKRSLVSNPRPATFSYGKNSQVHPCAVSQLLGPPDIGVEHVSEVLLAPAAADVQLQVPLFVVDCVFLHEDQVDPHSFIKQVCLVHKRDATYLSLHTMSERVIQGSTFLAIGQGNLCPYTNHFTVERWAYLCNRSRQHLFSTQPFL